MNAIELKQIVDIFPGFPFRSAINGNMDHGVLVVSMKDVDPQQGTVYWRGCPRTELVGKKMPDYLQDEDILFVARGNHNYSARIQLPYQGARVVAAPHFFVLRCTSPKVLPEYLTWYLNSIVTQRYFMTHTEGTLTKSIRRSVLADTPIALPPIDKQQAIIHLHHTLQLEQQHLQKLLKNGEQIMNAIAQNLLSSKN